MTIIVNVDWLENHKPGRNAYYQIFELKPDGGVPVTITHWGKITPAVEQWHRPVLGGEYQIFKGAIRGTKASAKKKRGYAAVGTKNLRPLKGGGWLVETFGAALAHELEVAMFFDKMVYDPSLVPTEEHDNEFMRETAKAEPEIRPENWGSW